MYAGPSGGNISSVPVETGRLRCDVCTNPFSSTKYTRQPVVGHCGHSFCRRCTVKLKKKCAACRSVFQPAVNYALITALEELNQVKRVLKETIRKQNEMLRKFGAEVKDDSGVASEVESEEEEQWDEPCGSHQTPYDVVANEVPVTLEDQERTLMKHRLNQIDRGKWQRQQAERERRDQQRAEWHRIQGEQTVRRQGESERIQDQARQYAANERLKQTWENGVGQRNVAEWNRWRHFNDGQGSSRSDEMRGSQEQEEAQITERLEYLQL